jgi:hypothetical protein
MRCSVEPMFRFVEGKGLVANTPKYGTMPFDEWQKFWRQAREYERFWRHEQTKRAWAEHDAKIRTKSPKRKAQVPTLFCLDGSTGNT